MTRTQLIKMHVEILQTIDDLVNFYVEDAIIRDRLVEDLSDAICLIIDPAGLTDPIDELS